MSFFYYDLVNRCYYAKLIFHIKKRFNQTQKDYSKNALFKKFMSNLVL
mgnify:CR=1 FL=1